MDAINVTKARDNLYNLMIQVNRSHEPIQITGKNGNAVLISDEDWRAIQETLYLKSIKGFEESLSEIDGDNEWVSLDEVDW